MTKKNVTDITITLDGEYYHNDDGFSGDDEYTWAGTDGYVLEEVRAFLSQDGKTYDGSIGTDWRTLPGKLSVGDDVYVVIENFSTGSTFGKCESKYEVADVFLTRKEAEKYVEDESNHVDGFFDEHIDFEIYVLELE